MRPTAMGVIDLRYAQHARAGTKAGALGHLLRAGFPVPPGFVIPAGAPLDPARIKAELQRLAQSCGTDRVAVRSSASAEDLAGASAAGQFTTVLGARGAEEVQAAVGTVRDSLWSARAAHYRGPDTAPGTMAVLVQSQVDAHASGVMFTSDPVVIEAVPGPGEALVHGRVTPDRWVVTDGHHPTRPGPGQDSDTGSWCLTDVEVHGLIAQGLAVHEELGGPQDIEWVIDQRGRVWIVQARPVTATLPAVPTSSRTPDILSGDGLGGLAASSGRAIGPARLVHSLDDFPRVKPGDVLVCPTTDPAWTPLFGIVAGVVTEQGGLLAHAAIVAREFGIPAVLAAAGATTALVEGTLIEVDGDTGVVRVLE